MHLINTPPNPWYTLRKINLIAQQPSSFFVRPQRVHRARDDGGVGFLVVEDGEGGAYADCGEDGEGAEPDVGSGDGGQGAVGAAFHERAGVGFGGGD